MADEVKDTTSDLNSSSSSSELKIGHDPDVDPSDTLRNAEDASYDIITLEPAVMASHAQPLALINNSYRVLKDGGTLRVAFLDKDANVKTTEPSVNHFGESLVKQIFTEQAPFERAQYTKKDKWLIVSATKLPGQMKVVDDSLEQTDPAVSTMSSMAPRNGNIANGNKRIMQDSNSTDNSNSGGAAAPAGQTSKDVRDTGKMTGGVMQQQPDQLPSTVLSGVGTDTMPTGVGSDAAENSGEDAKTATPGVVPAAVVPAVATGNNKGKNNR